MFPGLKQFQTFELHRRPQYVHLSLLGRGGRGREFSYFLSGLPTRVCSTETLSDSSNYCYHSGNLQSFLKTVGLLETESLGVAWGLLQYIDKCSFHRGRQDASAGGKDGSIPCQPGTQRNGNSPHSASTALSFQHRTISRTVHVNI